MRSSKHHEKKLSFSSRKKNQPTERQENKSISSCLQSIFKLSIEEDLGESFNRKKKFL